MDDARPRPSSPRDPRADPLGGSGSTCRIRLLRFVPATGAVGCTGVVLVKRPLPAAPADREQQPELVGPGPGINQPGQAAAPGERRQGVPFPAINDAKRPSGVPLRGAGAPMPLLGLDIEITTDSDSVSVRLRGETDISTHEQLLAGLAAWCSK